MRERLGQKTQIGGHGEQEKGHGEDQADDQVFALLQEFLAARAALGVFGAASLAGLKAQLAQPGQQIGLVGGGGQVFGAQGAGGRVPGF